MFAPALSVLLHHPAAVFKGTLVVGDKIAKDRLSEVTAALTALEERDTATEALSGVRLDRFEAIDMEALERAEEAFDGTAE